MILYEYEGKRLLKEAGIAVPRSQLINSEDSVHRMTVRPPLVLKAQVLSGKRAEAGGIIRIKNQESRIKGELQKLFKKTINKEKVEKILVEEMVEYEGLEYYVSISYDTDSRGPVLTISQSGGTGIEERETQTFPIDPLTLSCTAVQQNVNSEIIDKLIKLFFNQDLLLLEINPLVKIKGSPSTSVRLPSTRLRTSRSLQALRTKSYGFWVALDAKVKIEDNALSRHQDPSISSGEPWNFPPRSVPGHSPTKNEIEAKKIDEGDYRGVAGSTYFDLDGKPSASLGPSIAILASGGGASLTAMDALLKAGGKPANYTEYGGNPPREKVEKLTRIVLSKPGIHGLWVVGAVANFTDIYETLSGFMAGLRNLRKEGVKIDLPIVIRRGGPRDKEAFEMLRQVKDFDLHLYGQEISITKSAQIMAELAKKYATSS